MEPQKPEEGTGVDVGLASIEAGAVGSGVTVGGTDVAVADGVGVGGSGVGEGGTGVRVGTGVTVEGTGVAVEVGATGVGTPTKTRPKSRLNLPLSYMSVVPDLAPFKKNSTICPTNSTPIGCTTRFR